MKTEQINPAVRADKVTHRRTFTDSGNNKLLFLRHVRSNPCLWSADQQDELRNRQAAWSNLLGFFLLPLYYFETRRKNSGRHITESL